MTTWIKLHDNFWENPKVLAAGEDAALLYVQGLCFCSSHLTDGWIPGAALRVISAKSPRRAKALAAALVAAGLWVDEPGGWQVHDYDEHQRTRAEVDKLRSRNNRRASIHRNPALKAAIRGRDGNACRYCGTPVDWANRRGPNGATYDHVDPNGPDTLDNLVVACRACNSLKGSRTPAAAGLTLRPDQVRTKYGSGSGPSIYSPEVETEAETETPPNPPAAELERGTTTLAPEQVAANLAAVRSLKPGPLRGRQSLDPGRNPVKLTNKQAEALARRLVADAPPGVGATLTHHETVPGLDEPSWRKLKVAVISAVVDAVVNPAEVSERYDDEHGVDSRALLVKAGIPRR